MAGPVLLAHRLHDLSRGALATLGYGFARTYRRLLSRRSPPRNIYLAIPGVAILCALGYVTVLMRRRLRPQAEQHSNRYERGAEGGALARAISTTFAR